MSLYCLISSKWIMKALKKLLRLPEKKFRIFVVEDSDIFRDLLSVFIKEIGSKKKFREKISCEVHSFKSGEECVQALNEKPDIVVLDYQLDPGAKRSSALGKKNKPMNGLETLKVIKKVLPSVEAVMVTAKGDFSVNTGALDAGAAEYLEKGPGIREKLQNTIADLMKKIIGDEPGQPALA